MFSSEEEGKKINEILVYYSKSQPFDRIRSKQRKRNDRREKREEKNMSLVDYDSLTDHIYIYIGRLHGTKEKTPEEKKNVHEYVSVVSQRRNRKRKTSCNSVLF